MIQPKLLRPGDKVAIVSLSSGMLGEEFCNHNITIGVRRLEEFGLTYEFMPHALKGITYLKKHPEARAADLKQAFLDDSIAGIVCAIGGDDTYRLLPYLMEDEEFVKAVKSHPKIFTGFSDTTCNHLMLYQLGLVTYYGPCFLCDLGEMAPSMLPYTRKAFLSYMEGNTCTEIVSSDVWYEERTDFSKKMLGTERVVHREKHAYELLQGEKVFSGQLLGGCLESLCDMLGSSQYKDEQKLCEKYHVFPSLKEWKGKILFIETCEEKPTPNRFREELGLIKKRGVFDVINGIIVGKPQDETFYEEYKAIFKEVIEDRDLPILYNVNFGHATPRCVIPYGIEARIDMEHKKISFVW